MIFKFVIKSDPHSVWWEVIEFVWAFCAPVLVEAVWKSTVSSGECVGCPNNCVVSLFPSIWTGVYPEHSERMIWFIHFQYQGRRKDYKAIEASQFELLRTFIKTSFQSSKPPRFVLKRACHLFFSPVIEILAKSFSLKSTHYKASLNGDTTGCSYWCEFCIEMHLEVLPNWQPSHLALILQPIIWMSRAGHCLGRKYRWLMA